ncbi:drug/metabolite transporter (DMT)-like permease [Silvimonas terrae]|uniref:Drug/metabolite transporter (DMT)-like permease n=1 Tax=Silvimonas terrae TaxID=300266 RepID=A0A840RED0_9NEIS|nr:DMT family transporter [Silvimonas terrae]MBB5190611.1 drug/metabolite transporter (DMT)-like permease [Silvimonas terrae]
MTTHRFARIAPALFVLLWSSGFVGARLGIPWAPPMHFLVARFALVLLLLGLSAPLLRVQWPRGRLLGHVIAAGLLVQTGYFAGVFQAMHHGLSAGMVALIAGLQPVVVSVVAGLVLDEKRGWRQWLGLLLGLAGVLLVIEHKLGQGVITLAGVAFCLLALLSISLGTVYQKRFCAGVDVSATSIVHCVISLLVLAPIALIEPGAIVWHGAFIFALLWVSLVVSIGAIGILLWLLRHGEAGQVSGLFFLVPPTTAIIAWLTFGEAISGLMWLGMMIAMLGVWLARSPGRMALPE